MTDPIDRPFLPNSEPSSQQEGVDVPGFWSGTSDYINWGVYNGNFRLAVADAGSNIDLASSVVGSNFVPGWRFVQSSNTTVTGQMIQTTTPWTGAAIQGAGSNFRFNHDGTTTAGTAYLEQIIDLGGSVTGLQNGVIATETLRRSGTWTYRIARQYLAADGSLSGMPPEVVTSYTLTAETTVSIEEVNQSDGVAPAQARYLRLRYIAESSSANGVLDLMSIRRQRAMTSVPLIGVTGFGTIQWDTGSNLSWNPASGTGGVLLNRQPMQLTFVSVNVAAGATTQAQYSANIGIGTPRIPMALEGSIIAVSYRLSTAILTGTLDIAVRDATGTIWTAFALNNASAVQDYVRTGLDDYPFDVGDNLGVEIVTNGSFTPTTLDLIVVVWLAVRVA